MPNDPKPTTNTIDKHLIISVLLLLISAVAHFFQPQDQIWTALLWVFVGVVGRALGAERLPPRANIPDNIQVETIESLNVTNKPADRT